MGPEQALGQPQAASTLNPNDVLFGLIGATCPTCRSDRYYWVYFVVDQGGWYAEKTGPGVKPGEKVNFDPNDFEQVPLNTRVPIENF